MRKMASNPGQDIDVKGDGKGDSESFDGTSETNLDGNPRSGVGESLVKPEKGPAQTGAGVNQISNEENNNNVPSVPFRIDLPSDFSSSTESSGDEDIPLGPEEDPGLHRRRVEIVRRLLQSFDLEETIDFYRCLSPREYKFDVADFSLSSSTANSRVKQRLERLMGSDVVKLNDRKYMLKLEKNIQQEYEAFMNKKEAERVNIEQQRMRKLAVQGLIDEFDELGNPRNRKSRRRRKVTYDDENSETGEDLNNIVNKGREPVHHARYQDTKGGKSRSQIEERTPSDDKEIDEQGARNETLAFEEPREEVDDRKPPMSPREKYESPLVKEMKQEETVAGLYSIAQRIVL